MFAEKNDLTLQQSIRWANAARGPAPPWTLRQLLVAVLLLGAMILFIAMAGHLAADCMFGTDCVPG
jgi:hypothetical protein